MRALLPAICLLVLALGASVYGHNDGTDYSTLGDILHFYTRTAQTHSQLLRFTELKEPGFPQAAMPLATITDSSVPDTDKSVGLLIFAEHAREIITTEVGLWLTRVLINDAAEMLKWPELAEAFRLLGIQASDIGSTLDSWRKRILTNMIVKMLPVENMEGRQQWEAGALCLRKTPKGVDLNRNYPFAWQQEGQHTEMYGGPHPLSEPQSRLITRLALERLPKTYVNVHSGEWAVYTTWDSKKAIGPGLPADLADLIAQSGAVCNCQAGPAGAVSNYLAYGTGMDFMYTQLGVPYALTLEVYGTGGAGVLRNGEKNTPLEAFPYTEDPGIAKQLPTMEQLLAASAATTHHHSTEHRLQALHNAHRGAALRRRRRQGHSSAYRARVLRAGAAGGQDAGDAAAALPAAAAAAGASFGGRSMRRRQLLQGGGGGNVTAAAGGRRLLQDVASLNGAIMQMVASKSRGDQRCFSMFNPMPGTEYRNVVARWVVQLMLTLQHVANPAHPLPSKHPLPGSVLPGLPAPWPASAASSASAASRIGLRLAEVAQAVDAAQARAEAKAAAALGAGTDMQAAAQGDRAVGTARRRLLLSPAGEAEGQGAAAVRAAVAADASAGIGGSVPAARMHQGVELDARERRREAERQEEAAEAEEDVRQLLQHARRERARGAGGAVLYRKDPLLTQHSWVVLVGLLGVAALVVPFVLRVRRSAGGGVRRRLRPAL